MRCIDEVWMCRAEVSRELVESVVSNKHQAGRTARSPQYRSSQWRRGGGPRHLRQRLPEGCGTEAQ
jgi:hypothetical protein